MRREVFMGTRKRRRFTEAFKQEAVRLCLRHDRSIGQVARELGPDRIGRAQLGEAVRG